MLMPLLRDLLFVPNALPTVSLQHGRMMNFRGRDEPGAQSHKRKMRPRDRMPYVAVAAGRSGGASQSQWS